ncbi:short-chain dehydrogenase reductase sdr [Colletotrichum musicola]|uniref:Short-chain dehydrogenase reductase sdr n=1 Tax=Colletotrichum musicola TaxID=2175873 RepID=A0A8H6KEK4_9PEZI|nr:short-chain dehydrogenase reductase sdr [Colletotrichum musicola]
MSPSYLRLALAALALLLAQQKLASQSRRRDKRLAHSEERVLVIGASSGVGRAVAKRYAARGARVCVVARREADIRTLADECGDRCIWHVADFCNVDDLVALRARLEKEWNGVDTLHVCAGVSALQPVMALTGTEDAREDAGAEGIRRAVEIAGRAVKGNFDGPLTTALTFIPMLKRTSRSPSILLVSSVAAVIPAPTRALYASTKASSLLLFQSLAIEHPSIAFTFVLPATIEGNFRASAVDAGPVREDDPNKHGLKIGHVAGRCVDAVDAGETGNVILPKFPYALAQILYQLWPSFIEGRARRKYNYEA